MSIVIRLLCCVVIAGAAITVWTRAALVFAQGLSLASVCLWTAAVPRRRALACSWPAQECRR